MLQRIAEDLWTQDTDLKLGPIMSMPTRATIARLSDGQLCVISPLAIDDAAAKEIAALGDVRYLVAPNLMHHMFLAAAKERFPRAQVLGAPGLEKKLGSLAFEPLPVEGALDAGDEIRVQRIEGAPGLTEHVFLHERSRSLVVADLMFNIQSGSSFPMSLFLRLTGTWRKTAQSRMWRFLVKDRVAAATSAQRVVAWDFERVVVAHGDVVEEDARERTRQALAWMTAGSAPLLTAA